MEKQQVTKADLQSIMKQMIQYNREDGFMAFVGTKLTFFDSEPSFGAAPINRTDLARYIDEFDNYEE